MKLTKREKRRLERNEKLSKLPPPLPDQWVSVARLAVAIGESDQAIYQALYDERDPLPCARHGRAIRVRLCDWRTWWDRKLQPVIRRDPPRAMRARGRARTSAGGANAGRAA